MRKRRVYALVAGLAAVAAVALMLVFVVIPGGGTQTIDLQALTDLEGVAQDGTGKKLQEIRVQADAANTAVINVAGAAVNPYILFGTGNDVDVPIGGLLHMRFNDKLPDVSNTASHIVFTGTAADSFSYEVVVG
jgi:hypothetical protein